MAEIYVNSETRLSDVLKTLGTHVSVNDTTFMFLPIWFKQSNDKFNDGKFIVHSLDHLPKELYDAIVRLRDKESGVSYDIHNLPITLTYSK